MYCIFQSHDWLHSRYSTVICTVHCRWFIPDWFSHIHIDFSPLSLYVCLSVKANGKGVWSTLAIRCKLNFPVWFIILCLLPLVAFWLIARWNLLNAWILFEGGCWQTLVRHLKAILCYLLNEPTCTEFEVFSWGSASSASSASVHSST